MVEPRHLLIRATNWVGDAVLSLPALRTVRSRFPAAEITLVARPWVADLYRREEFAQRVVLYTPRPGTGDVISKWLFSRRLRELSCDTALLFPNSFESAAVAWLAGVPRRLGYARDGRGWMLTHPVKPPKQGEIPRFEAFYYLELLRRLGWIDTLPAEVPIRLEGATQAAESGRAILGSAGLAGAVIGVSPGAAYGSAKRWLPERFAEAAVAVAGQISGSVALFGSSGERELCEKVAQNIESQNIQIHNFAGETSLGTFIDAAAACRVFLTNDSGAMHIASALGVPTVAVFGATDHVATGPTGTRSRVVRESVDCSPCLLRECPIDHRCMRRIAASRVADVALELLK